MIYAVVVGIAIVTILAMWALFGVLGFGLGYINALMLALVAGEL